MPSTDLAIVELRSYFVRHRNCLLVRVHFTDLYMDYYLHLMQHGIQHEEKLDTMLKEALAAMALHMGSRPHDERCAWTINVHAPLLNLFVTGGGYPQGQVTGRIFTDDVKDMGKSLIIAQTSRPNMQPRQSMIEFTGGDVLSAVEQFYTQSEQRPTRFFRMPEEDFVQISAEPDADLEWLKGLSAADIPKLDEAEQLSLLETRGYTFDCGCTVDRMFPMLSRLPKDDLDYIFEDGHADITCPRCGAKYKAPRELFEQWLAAQPKA
jgi:molecular chaperone Hsp33